MYPHFIEVEIRNGPKAIINIDNIKAVAPEQDLVDNAVIYYSVSGKEIVSESYDEVKQLIESSGCLINMGDPRLNTSKPLTWDELQNMVGEPVWNSNLSRWELVKRADESYVVTCSTGVYDNNYAEYDLVKYPLYRMKVNHE